MRKVILGCALIGALALAACSNSQLAGINAALDKYDLAIANFNAAVARIDTSVAFTSTSFAKYCTQAQEVGNNLKVIVSGNDTALAGLNTLSAAITSWCAAPPANTGDAVVAMTAAIAAGEQALKASGG